MTSRGTARVVRQKKLNTKTSLPIVREDEIDPSAEDDPQRIVGKVETGVEKGEETEHHLQAIISASVTGRVTQVYIPTPETKTSNVQYSALYPKRFSPPQTYIRFSSTVEDCIGVPYCMTEDDLAFLKTLNATKGKSNKDAEEPCSEDVFEEVMQFFEETSASRQPFAVLDNAPVMTFDEFENAYDETMSDERRVWAREIYEHWKVQRLKKANRPLTPVLKSETGQETDDSDPYVCFRRREVRQVRKTRGRDAQVVEKIKKLRNELEDARRLVQMINQREVLNKQRLATERDVFMQRSELKRVKIQQDIHSRKGEDEELLVNQKVRGALACFVHSKWIHPDFDQPASKTKPKLDTSQANLQRRASGPGGNRAAEEGLISLAHQQAEAAIAVQQSIADKIEQHRKWNNKWQDHTWRPITPPLESGSRFGYLLLAEDSAQLPTPPASIVSEHSRDSQKDVEMRDADFPTPTSPQDDQVAGAKDPERRPMFHFASPPSDLTAFADHSLYRRRYGRGGRLHIDERKPRSNLWAPSKDIVVDSDDSDYDQQPLIYHLDLFDDNSIKYRAHQLNSRGRSESTGSSHGRQSVTGGADVLMAGSQSSAGQVAGPQD
ncbi:Enhancer of polycomb-like protein 1 [Elasticomyces elasticus]|nr:Enhancer of polycomb-like protein 1 [Elasticomyces elasticus]